MVKSAQVQHSGIVWDGRPGVIIHGSDEVSLETAVTANRHLYIPWGMRFESVRLKVTQACGTAAGAIAIGKLGDADYYLDDYSVATSVTAGTELELINDAAMVVKDVAAGDVIYFNTDGGATSTGKAVVTCVLVAA